MTNFTNVGSVLMKHKDVICEEVDVYEVISSLVGRGVFTHEERITLLSYDEHQRMTQTLHCLSKKGFAAFQEFCHVLECSHPHLITCFLMDFAVCSLCSTSSTSNGQPNGDVNDCSSNVADLSSRPDISQPNNSHRMFASLPRAKTLARYLNSSQSKEFSHLSKSFAKSLSQTELSEQFQEPVNEDTNGDWIYCTVTLNRVPKYGFGIAVSGGSDNSHFTSGDTSIVISDVLLSGPAVGKLRINDRVLKANSISLINVKYERAINILKECGSTVHLRIKRKISSDSEFLPNKFYRTQMKFTQIKDVNFATLIYVKDTQHPASHTNNNSDRADKTLISDHCQPAGVMRGDILLQVNGVSVENLSVAETSKLIEASAEPISLTLLRQPSFANRDIYAECRIYSNHDRQTDNNVYEFSSQRTTVYKRDRMPSSTQPNVFSEYTDSIKYDPDSSLISSSHHNCNNLYSSASHYSSTPRSPKVRRICFCKENSVGIRLAGGNMTGIFVTAVQNGSPAATQGLMPGDKLLEINGHTMSGVTREDVVLFLLSLRDHVDMLVSHSKEEYDRILAKQIGDSFYIRTRFNYEQTSRNELSFHTGDIFHVIDTLSMGVVGAWQVTRIGRNNEETQRGIIPNLSRANELACSKNVSSHSGTISKSENVYSVFTNSSGASNSSALVDSPSSMSRFFTLRGVKGSSSKNPTRNRALSVSDKLTSCGQVMSSSVVSSTLQAYERVILQSSGCTFKRPVVVFGALADLARSQLLYKQSQLYCLPESETSSRSKNRTVRLSSIRSIMDNNKHALLDITPEAVQRLSSLHLFPISIFLRTDSKRVIKDAYNTAIAQHSANTQQSSTTAKSHQGGHFFKQYRSTRKLYEEALKLESQYSHLFTAIITVTDSHSWYNKLEQVISSIQNAPLWIADKQFCSIGSQGCEQVADFGQENLDEKIYTNRTIDSAVYSDTLPLRGTHQSNYGFTSRTITTSASCAKEMNQNSIGNHSSSLYSSENVKKQTSQSTCVSSTFYTDVLSTLSHIVSAQQTYGCVSTAHTVDHVLPSVECSANTVVSSVATGFHSAGGAATTVSSYGMPSVYTVDGLGYTTGNDFNINRKWSIPDVNRELKPNRQQISNVNGADHQVNGNDHQNITMTSSSRLYSLHQATSPSIYSASVNSCVLPGILNAVTSSTASFKPAPPPKPSSFHRIPSGKIMMGCNIRPPSTTVSTAYPYNDVYINYQPSAANL